MLSERPGPDLLRIFLKMKNDRVKIAAKAKNQAVFRPILLIIKTLFRSDPNTLFIFAVVVNVDGFLNMNILDAVAGDDLVCDLKTAENAAETGVCAVQFRLRR